MVPPRQRPGGDAGSPSTGYDIATTVTRDQGLQWPLCYGYSHPLEQSGCGGLTAPGWSSENSTFIPTGATWVDAAGPAPYRDHFIFCTYGEGMMIFSLATPHDTVSAGDPRCRLDVVQGPDHAVYFSDETTIVKQN